MRDHEGTLQIQNEDTTTKTKLILARFGGNFGTLRFDEKSFFTILLGFTPFWNYESTNALHADSPGVYTGEKISYLSKTDKIHLKYGCIDASVVNGLKQPKLYSFLLDRPAGYKFFCQLGTVHHKKLINLF